MTPKRCFFLSDGQDAHAVHGKRGNRRATMRGQTHASETFPLEMLRPVIMAWVIESYFFAAVRIKRCLTCSFTERTRDTGQGQILSDRLAACHDRNTMVDVKCRLLSCL
jgi:hypothetical protein